MIRYDYSQPYITRDEYLEVKGIDLNIELQDDDNQSNKVNRFIQDITNFVLDHLVMEYNCNELNRQTNQFEDLAEFRRVRFHYGMLEQIEYVLNNGLIQLDSGINRETGAITDFSGIVIGSAALKQFRLGGFCNKQEGTGHRGDLSPKDMPTVEELVLELGKKVDRVDGKGLSTNDYSTADKLLLKQVAQDLDSKVDQENGKVLSDNNFSDAYKEKLDGIESGAQQNVIEEIKLENQPISVAGKSVNIDVSHKENKSNKSTSISSASTDIQYPSARAVHNAVESAKASAEDYADSKVTRANLVQVLGEASQYLNGLMSAQDKERLDVLYALLGDSEDANTVVDTINEVLAIFNQYPEGASLVNALAAKVNYSDIVNAVNSNETSKALSAAMGKYLKDLIDALTLVVNAKANSNDVYTKSEVDTMVSGGLANKQDKLTPTTVQDGSLAKVLGFDSQGNIKKGDPMINDAVPTSRTIAGISLENDISSNSLETELSKDQNWIKASNIDKNIYLKLDYEIDFLDLIDWSVGYATMSGIDASFTTIRYSSMVEITQEIYDAINETGLVAKQLNVNVACVVYNENQEAIANLYPPVSPNDKILISTYNKVGNFLRFNCVASDLAANKVEIYTKKYKQDIKTLEWLRVAYNNMDTNEINYSMNPFNTQTGLIQIGFDRNRFWMKNGSLFTSNNTFCTTQSFKVYEGQHLKVIPYYKYNKEDTVDNGAFVDSEGNWVAGLMANSTWDENHEYLNVIVPSNASYLQLNIVVNSNGIGSGDSANNNSFAVINCTFYDYKLYIPWIDISNVDIPNGSITENKLSSGVKSKLLPDYINTYKYWDSINKPIELQGKTLRLFGDSIAAGYMNEGSGNYVDVSKSFAGLLATKFSMTRISKAEGGATFSLNDTWQPKAILTQITETVFDNDNTEIILIAGGTNDYNQGRQLGTYNSNDSYTVYGALRNICEYLKTNAPNSVVIFITPINCTVSMETYNHAIMPLNRYRNAIWEIATEYGFNVVDGSTIGLPDRPSDWGNTMIAQNDGVHPTAKGHALYFRGLCGKLK